MTNSAIRYVTVIYPPEKKLFHCFNWGKISTQKKKQTIAEVQDFYQSPKKDYATTQLWAATVKE